MTPYPLSKSDTNTKVLITLFLVTMLAAFAVAELNVYDKVGRVKNGVAQRYGPEPGGRPEPSKGPAADETLPASEPAEPGELPLEGETLVARMNTFSTLVDVTHSHVFELPLVLFVLAHFLMRTRAAQWFKLSNYLLAFGGITAFLAAPWLVRYISVRAAPTLYAGAAAIGTSVLFMVVVSLWDLWTRPANTRPSSVRSTTAPARAGLSPEDSPSR